MLPVPHQACTLATGALRSSLTIKVKPSGRTHFFAVLGGNVISAESFTGAAFKFSMIKTNAETSPATLTRYTIYCLFDSANQQRRPQSGDFRRRQTRASLDFFLRLERFRE